jgi:hypothetical protein
MKRFMTLALAAFALFAVVPVTWADTPPTLPFPSGHAGAVFVSAQTVTTDGAMSNYVAPGSSVVFRAYAVDGKTHKLLTKKNVKFFNVVIPNAPTLKLKYTPRAATASSRYVWTATWNVPADYPTGVVAFRVIMKTKAKRVGSFVQIPVASSMLTVTVKPQNPPGSGPGGSGTAAAGKVQLALYVDSVNGTRPKGAEPRPIGCTQTNVYRRGEQFVLRSWGYDLTTGSVLSLDNVIDAHFTVPGNPDVKLNWGAHGPSKVWFWTNAWNIPKDYPLGDITVRVSFKTDAGKTETFNYVVTIIP